MEDHRTPQHDGSDQHSKKAATSDKPALTNDHDHIPAPAPHVGGDPPRVCQTLTGLLIDAGGEQWVSAKHPVDVQEVR